MPQIVGHGLKHKLIFNFWVKNILTLATEINALFIVGLATGENQVSVFDNATEVSLSCEMFLYLRPDEDLQWFRGGQLITSGSGRHSITYTDGSGLGQFGGDELGSSRVSTLVISQLQTSDSGTYTCAIRNTQHSQDLQLTVESNGTVGNCSNLNIYSPSVYLALITEDTPSPSSNTPSATPTPSDSVSTQSDSLPTPSDSTADSSQLLFVYIGNGAALLIIVVVMTVVVLCIALMLFKKGKMLIAMCVCVCVCAIRVKLHSGNANKLAAVNLASDVIPEEGHHFNADIMTEDNVAYETKPPFNKGTFKLLYIDPCGIRMHTGGAKQPTSLDPVYEIIPEERGDSEPAAIMLEANMAYERKPVLNEGKSPIEPAKTDYMRNFFSGEANQPDTVDIVYEEIIPEERQDSRPAIVLETNLAYETKPEDSIMLEANQAYEERQDSRADIMTEDNPAYEGPVIA